jgi:hypothetical protein
MILWSIIYYYAICIMIRDLLGLWDYNNQRKENDVTGCGEVLTAAHIHATF